MVAEEGYTDGNGQLETVLTPGTVVLDGSRPRPRIRPGARVKFKGGAAASQAAVVRHVAIVRATSHFMMGNVGQ